MPFKFVLGDITKLKVDAVVNAANRSLLGGGGVDGAIHRAAGPALLRECMALGGCETGEAKATGAGNLPARYVIHTVGPVWRGGGRGERESLASCYRRSLELARQLRCSSVAFPLISSGVYGYPKAEALEVAVSEIGSFLSGSDMDVVLAIFSPGDFHLPGRLAASLLQRMEEARNRPAPVPAATPPDESFVQMVLRKMEEKGMGEEALCRRANVPGGFVSQIRGCHGYRPVKPVAAALAVGLELPLDEAEALLAKSGATLASGQRSDLALRCLMEAGEFSVHEINEVMFHYGEPQLGCLATVLA